MQTVLLTLSAIGFATFGVSAFSLFILWIYFLLRITGHYSGTAERDAKARQLGRFFGKLFGFSIAYAIALIVVIHVVGPPP